MSGEGRVSHMRDVFARAAAGQRLGGIGAICSSSARRALRGVVHGVTLHECAVQRFILIYVLSFFVCVCVRGLTLAMDV